MLLYLPTLARTLRVVRNNTTARVYYSTTATLAQKANFWQRALQKTERMEKEQQQRRAAEKNKLPRNAYKKGPKLRGDPRDEGDVRISKTLSWVLRHGAKTEGLPIRQDGYARVKDLLALPRFRDVDFQRLERIVQHDAKERYHLLFEPNDAENAAPEDCWWIRANQGHSMKDINLEFTEITDAGQVPMAVHGTNFVAWEKIREQGLSPMKRTHIHLAQHISDIKGAKATPGLRSSSQVLIYIDLDKALRAGIRFYLSENGVVLTKGDESGYLRPEFFQRVTDAWGAPFKGWSGSRPEEWKRQMIESDRNEKQRRRSGSRGEVTEEAPIKVSGPNVDSAVLSAMEALSTTDLKEI